MVALDEQAILTLDSKKMNQLEEQARRRDFFLPDLQKALKKKADTMKMVETKISSNLKFEGKVMVIADKDTPYWLITEILYTAAESEFEQYNLVAMKTVQD